MLSMSRQQLCVVVDVLTGHLGLYGEVYIGRGRELNSNFDNGVILVVCLLPPCHTTAVGRKKADYKDDYIGKVGIQLSSPPPPSSSPQCQRVPERTKFT
jgi:hypothetical protein